MQKLSEVEEARALMSEAHGWSLWRWLTDKRRVRETADKATEALAKSRKSAQRSWSDDLNKAYNELVAEAALDGAAATKRKYEKAKAEAEHVDPKIKVAARRVKDADEEAQRATMAAEETFAAADAHMSPGTAREGTQKALESYDLREKAIRKAEAAGRPIDAAK
jgi:hypothetical protein